MQTEPTDRTATALRWLKTKRKRLDQSYRRFVSLYLKDRTLRQTERFVAGWLGIFILAALLIWQQFGTLKSHYLVDGPAPGGHYIEGMVGTIGGINPIFPEGQVSEAASRLIFSGLFQVDGHGEIVPDLARSYSVNDDQTVYTVELRDDIYWHDEQPVTARDVVFTVEAIQDPDVASPLQINWQDITVTATGERSVEFGLPNPYAPFLSQLTLGIVPAHLLADVAAERLRVAAFNFEPVGSGPFEFHSIAGGRQIQLRANEQYHFGTPQLNRFSLAVFDTEEDLAAAYNRNELAAMVASSDFEAAELAQAGRSVVTPIELGGQVFAFFDTTRLSERALRQGLVQSIDTQMLRRELGSDYRAALSPLLPSHLGYQPAQLGFDSEVAQQRFEDAGLTREGDRWHLDGEPLALRLVTQDNYSYPRLARLIEQQWEVAGVGVEVIIADAATLQEEYLRPRNYDVLVFGIGLDVDPDVFAYWHSSQVRDPGRNVSRYQSEIADIALEDGRTRIDTEIRAAKYQSFQQRWRTDAPAVALHRLHGYYIYRQQAEGIEVANIAHPVDRFYNVTDWTINTQPIERRLQP